MDEATRHTYARAFEVALKESTPTAADRAQMILAEAQVLVAIEDAEGCYCAPRKRVSATKHGEPRYPEQRWA
jgi:hypothetical protein